MALQDNFPQSHPEDESFVSDERKTREQLIDELTALRRHVAKLEIVQNVRQFLDLNQVLRAAVEEVRQFLQVDRVVVYQFSSDWSGLVVAESLGDPMFSIINLMIRDPCFEEAKLEAYLNGRIHCINDVLVDELDPCYAKFLTQLHIRAVLVVPILLRRRLWGLLVAHQCTSPQQWQPMNGLMLQQLSDQLAVAIQQSQLYQEVSQLNQQLERKVRLRTAQLQQALEFEALLKRITDRVRDSLDDAQIFQSAVHELALGLRLTGCAMALYDLQQRTSTIHSEYICSELPSAQGQIVQMAGFPDLYDQLLQGQPIQFCQVRSIASTARHSHRDDAILACPLVDDRQVIGDLWLFKLSAESFNTLEIRLVQQVANQCAIALRQSRLYQMAQAQVDELERLNHLKDDFLSMVSHELRTPMSSIKMALQMLNVLLFKDEGRRMKDQSSVVETPKASEALQETSAILPPDASILSSSFTLHPASLQRVYRYFQILQDECEREIDVINNLLDLSHLNAETEPLVLSTINPHLWIPHVVEPFEECIRRQRQQLQLDLPAALPPVRTDLSYLKRILTELLTNACKYTPSGERITVSACVVRDDLLPHSIPSSPDPLIPSPIPLFYLSVSNTGVEIPLDECDRIFDKFYRVPSSDPWKPGGTGLGLALVKKLVDCLGGTIQVESVAGQTTFTVLLPLFE